MQRWIPIAIVLLLAGTAAALLISGNEPELQEVVVEVGGGGVPGLAAVIPETATAAAGLAAIIVELERPFQNCMLGGGSWRNHPDIWPVQSLTLGTVSYSQTQLLDIINEPVRGNGLVSLAHQLIPAKLNLSSGAGVPAPVLTAINDADALIGGLVIPPVGTGALAPNVTSPLIEILDDFNNGLSPGGPPSCDVEAEEEE